MNGYEGMCPVKGMRGTHRENDSDGWGDRAGPGVQMTIDTLKVEVSSVRVVP